MDARFRLSAFGDEIAADLEEQLRVLRELRIRHLELRGVWGKNVLKLSDAEATDVRRLCDQNGVTVSAIGSPIGKSPIEDPAEVEEGNLQRIFEIARLVGTDRVRVFSFYPPENASEEEIDALVPESARRLRRLTDMATDAGMRLILENERGIVGDTIARCHALLTSINRPQLGLAWDPSNFVGVGEERSVERGWPLLGARVTHVHIKDGKLDGSGVRVAGEGDGQVSLLLTRLRESGYQGFLALEPHLAIAGHSSGFSGPDGMAHAVAALRRVMAETGCVEEF